MNILNRLPSALLIGILCASLPAQADELQDATQLFKQGQQGPALNKVNSYLTNRPRDAQARFLKGLIMTEQGKAADAIKIFSELTQDYPELPEPYNNLAVLYASQNQYDKAKSALEMAIRTHPSYATAHENLGDIYAKMASQAYDRALQLDKGNTTTQTKLAMIQDLFSDKSHKSAALRPPVAAKPVAEAPKAVAAKPVAEPVKAEPVKVAAESSKAKPEAANPAEKALQQSVEDWAQAWSDKNVKKYLAHYAQDFKTPNGESRSSWAATRNSRISAPKHIDVNVSGFNIEVTDSTHATVKFRQDYKASNFKSSGGKTLVMVKNGGNWLIQQERNH